jgi:hypothetical protein
MIWFFIPCRDWPVSSVLLTPMVNIAHLGFMKRKGNRNIFGVFGGFIEPRTELPAMPNLVALRD